MELKTGYKSTEIGKIPDDWACKTLGELTLKVGSGITPRGGERVYKKEGRPFLRSQNVGWGRLLKDDIAYIDDETHSSFDATEVFLDDVLLNITGASIGRSALSDESVAGGNVNQHVCIIRTDPGALDPSFLNQFLLSGRGQYQVDSFQAGGNRQGLNFGQICSFIVPLPPLPEQRAIAAALLDVDALVEKLDALIAKKRAIKAAAMQRLLTGEQRLPGFDRTWTTKRLGEIGTFSKGKGILRKDTTEDGLPCVRYAELYTHHRDIIHDFVSFIPEYIAKEAQRLKQGDLLFAGSGETKEEIGMCAAYLGEGKAYAGGDIVILSPTSEDSRFLGYALNTPAAVEQKSSMAQGDAVVHLYARHLSELTVLLPPKDEQEAIANILSDMDAEIEALQTRRDKTQVIKQGMMQELLTGRTRLV